MYSHRSQKLELGLNPITITGMALFVLLVFSLFVGIFIWFGCRIEPGPGQYVTLVKNNGKDITNDVIISDSSQKGLQEQILTEGRHFRNPITWDWGEPRNAKVIHQGNVGIKIRKYGKELPEGQVLAEKEDQKGIVPLPLSPGRYYINEEAYKVEEHPMVKVEPGSMGVVTLLVGKNPKNPNLFVMEKGERGPQPYLLRPGTHPEYSNPYVFFVKPVDVRSQKFTFELIFPSKWGFDIAVEGTIEWAPNLKRLPEIFVKYVDEEDFRTGGIKNIEQKVILPFARGYFRLIGSSFRAVDYMTGDARKKVQKEVETELKKVCSEEGIEIRSVVIQDARPPKEIRDQYGRRELARREIVKFQQMIDMEIGSPIVEGGKTKINEDGTPVYDDYGRLVIVGGKIKTDESGNVERSGGRIEQILQQRRKNREEELGKVRIYLAQIQREAEEYQQTTLTKAEKDLEVSKIRLDTVKNNADANRSNGFADAEVISLKNKAEAEGIKAKVDAFGGGANYAEFLYVKKYAPSITSILSNTKDSFAADLFERFSQIKSNSSPLIQVENNNDK